MPIEHIIGVDPSLSAFSCVSLDVDGIVQKSIVIASKKKGPERLDDIMIKFFGFIESVGNKDDVYIFIEDYSYGSRGRGTISLAELGGVLRYSLYKQGFMFSVFAPSQPKKFITGKGNADKTTTVKSVIRKYNVDFNTEDEYDAFSVAELGRNYLMTQSLIAFKDEDKWTDYQKDVINAILKAQKPQK